MQCVRIRISGAEGKIKIELKNIIYCMSNNTYTNFHLVAPIQKLQTHMSTVSIKDWEKCLINSSICRIHNRYLVNLIYIDKYKAIWNGGMLTLKNGIKLNVSKSRKENLKKRLRLM